MWKGKEGEVKLCNWVISNFAFLWLSTARKVLMQMKWEKVKAVPRGTTQGSEDPNHVRNRREEFLLS